MDDKEIDGLGDEIVSINVDDMLLDDEAETDDLNATPLAGGDAEEDSY